jgi:hypothetical protein
MNRKSGVLDVPCSVNANSFLFENIAHLFNNVAFNNVSRLEILEAQEPDSTFIP